MFHGLHSCKVPVFAWMVALSLPVFPICPAAPFLQMAASVQFIFAYSKISLRFFLTAQWGHGYNHAVSISLKRKKEAPPCLCSTFYSPSVPGRSFWPSPGAGTTPPCPIAPCASTGWSTATPSPRCFPCPTSARGAALCGTGSS